MKAAFYEDRDTATIAAEKLKVFAQPQRHFLKLHDFRHLLALRASMSQPAS